MNDEKIVYLCSATKGAIVNFVPIAEVGLERIKAVVVLCGVNEPPSPRDHAEAIGPAERLKSVLIEQGLARDQIQFVDGNPFDLDFWRRQVSELAIDREQSGEAFWLNITSGTRDMALGALFALVGEGRTGHRVMMVKGDPLRIEWPLEAPGGTAPTQPPYQRPQVDLRTYLALYGFTEMEREERERRQSLAWNAKDQVWQIYRSFVHPGRSGINSGDVIGAVNRWLHSFNPETMNVPLCLAWGDIRASNDVKNAVKVAVAAAARHVNVKPAEQDATIGDKAALRFLKGGWLEEAAYVKLRETIGESASLGVRFGVPASQSGGGNSLQEYNELDVCAMIGGQLHIVECKTGLFSNSDGAEGAGQNAINKLTFFRDSLLGQFGALVLLNPRSVPAGSNAQKGLEQMRGRGRFVSVELHTGEEAMAVLKRQFEQLRSAPS